jgi:hypothetical protein
MEHSPLDAARRLPPAAPRLTPYAKVVRPPDSFPIKV